MVRKCLCKLSNSCTIPPDEIPSYILKKTLISLIITIIYNIEQIY